jgi:nucleoside-diphosphate-sugar epimerase
VNGPILITGGTGFVGASLVRELIATGFEVHLILRNNSASWRLAGLEGRYTPHEADLRDAEAVRQVVAACRPAVVYHLAAHGTSSAQRDRAAILGSNVLGTANLLQALDGHDYQALVHAGSSSEYGHKDRPMRASDVLEPRSDYAVGKAAATLLCQAEALRGRPVSTIRIFSAYGPWEDPSRLASSVMASCRRGERPGVSDGTAPRDFIYIDDVISLLLTAATPAARGQILHAGRGRRCTVRDLVETILDVCTGGRLEANYDAIPNRADEPVCWQADLGATTARTGWRPRIDLRTGVARMWRWFQEHVGRMAA